MWQWFLNLDNLFIVVVVVVTIYFIIRTPKQKYEFIGLKELGEFSEAQPLESGYPFSIGQASQYRGARASRGQTSQSPHGEKKLWKREEKCREIFERIYNVKFKSIRPDWLKNPATNRALEIDGFNDSIKTQIGTGLGFECDGEQHSRYTPHFHGQNPRQFVYQTKKDSWKDKICRERGIVLVRIPYNVVMDDLERYITMRLRDLHVLPLGGG